MESSAAQNLLNDEQVPSEATELGDVAWLKRCAEASEQLKVELGRVVVGQEAVVELMLIALLARGHALLVGVPGLAKTLLVSSMAELLGLSFGRIQFTPDLLPADITGTDVLQDQSHPGRRRVEFLPGPVFHNLVLADEINRTPPKTQAALLEAMQERSVTVGTSTHSLPTPFQVFATRNPIEQEGTYPLPEAQLDRFLLEIEVRYPSQEEEYEVALRTTSAARPPLTPIVSAEELRGFSRLAQRVPITEQALRAAVLVTRATRPGESTATGLVRRAVRFGAGPRGCQALVIAAKARAALHGKAVADLSDVQAVLLPVLRHRITMGYRADLDGVDRSAVIDSLRGIVAKTRKIVPLKPPAEIPPPASPGSNAKEKELSRRRFSVVPALGAGTSALIDGFIPTGLALGLAALLPTALLFLAVAARLALLSPFEWGQVAQLGQGALSLLLELGLWGIIGGQLAGAWAWSAGAYTALGAIRGQPLSFGRALLPRRFVVTWTVLLLGTLASILASLFFVVPGLIVVMGLTPVVFCVVDSEDGPLRALRRSFELTRGHKFRLFGLHLLLGIVMLGLSLVPLLGFYVLFMPLYFLTLAWVYVRLNGEAP